MKRAFGLPGGTRTPDLLLRRQLLYPVELRAAGMAKVLNDTRVRAMSQQWLNDLAWTSGCVTGTEVRNAFLYAKNGFNLYW